MKILGGCPVSRFYGGVIFGKINWFYSSWDGALAFKKSEDQSGGPSSNLEVFGDEVSFQYFQKTWTSTSPMSCKTKPCQSSRQSFRIVRAIPLDTPRPPKFNLKSWKTRFCEKVDFCGFSAVFAVFWTPLDPIGPQGYASQPGGPKRPADIH